MTDLFITKHRALKKIREYFEKTGAVEVFTPCISPYPNLDPNIYPVELYVQKSDGKKIKAYLHTSPEYSMKKILANLKKDIYQISHVFRNYEGSKLHTVEFMMLEWYRVDFDLDMLMEDTKNIFVEVCQEISGKPSAEFRGKTYDLTDWEKITVDEAFYRYTGIYPDQKDKLYNFLRNSGIKHTGLEIERYEEIFFTVYAFYVEPNLGTEKPTFIYDYPPEFSALSRIIDGKGKRFEAYIGGIELVNGYQELTDTVQLKVRLEKDKAEKQKKGFDYPLNHELLEAVKDMPECSGASLGIDRFLMVLLNKENIKQTQGLNWI